ncbi:exostosin family protein [Artemisia annua]|uniref:Exostosin family protein n=1 Tax=Artemisia annua TaxID=35608 RepID=A0A2U1NZU5_ARTAN|nr:exostosin family protein [Artemisia annua]
METTHAFALIMFWLHPLVDDIMLMDRDRRICLPVLPLESPDLKFSGPEKLGKTDYFLHLRNAKFCSAPRGESSWTLRFYESFFSPYLFLSLISVKEKKFEYVPVLLSDQAELPSSRIDKRIEEMIARGRNMRCLWVYAPDSEPCSAFTGILWELQRKTRTFHHSPETFWLHKESIVDRDLVEPQMETTHAFALIMFWLHPLVDDILLMDRDRRICLPVLPAYTI